MVYSHISNVCEWISEKEKYSIHILRMHIAACVQFSTNLQLYKLIQCIYSLMDSQLVESAAILDSIYS